MARYFQITSLPPGEAPTEIQTAWIGCVMPLVAFRPSGASFGVLTRRRRPNRPGYTVRVLDAIAVLEQRSPAAAQWWRENTPYLIKLGKMFFFALESCRLCDANAAEVDAPVVVPAWRRMPMDEPAFPMPVDEPALPVGWGNESLVLARSI